MKIAIVGSRSFSDYDLMRETLEEYKITHIVSGGAAGADTLAIRYAMANGIPTTVHPAEWKKYGNSAGPLRNKHIVNDSDTVIAFWDMKSRGTKNCIEYARSMKKKVIVVDISSPEP